MAQPPIPQINGHRYSWASIEATFGDKKIKGFKSINYTRSLEPGKVYGTGPEKIGRTRGKADPTGSFEMYMEEWQDLINTLSNNGQVGYGEIAFDIVINYSETNVSPVITHTLEGCRITKADDSHSEGTDALTTKAELDVMHVDEDGVSIVTKPDNSGLST